MNFLFIAIVVCFAFFYFYNRRSNYENPRPDLWKPVDDFMPTLMRFKKLDEKGFAGVVGAIEDAKKEPNPERAKRHLARAVDEFSMLASLLPSGDSPYHDEIANLSAELAILGDEALASIAVQEKRAFEPSIKDNYI